MTLTLYTVNGTGAASSTDPGQYPAQVAQALLPSAWKYLADQFSGLLTIPLIKWVPIDYPAAIYPMGASVDTGIANLVAAIQRTGPGSPKALAGYSQGALVTSSVWRDYVLEGSLSAYEADFKAAVNWGNPMRCPTIPANGNAYAGWAPRSGGGISGTNDLTAAQTPSWWYDFANPNDLYTDSPVGTAAGSDEELIYNMIVTTNFGGTLAGLLKLIESAIEQFTQPLTEIIGIATAIFNALDFAGAGASAGHYTYDITPAITYLTEIGEQYAA